MLSISAAELGTLSPFCLILQLMLVGWLPATLWAIFAVSNWNTDRKIEKALADRS